MMRTLEEIKEILYHANEEAFDKLVDWTDKWHFGEAPKSRVDYWLKKIGITFEEWQLWRSTI